MEDRTFIKMFSATTNCLPLLRWLDCYSFCLGVMTQTGFGRLGTGTPGQNRPKGKTKALDQYVADMAPIRKKALRLTPDWIHLLI